jgi:phage internal scaffolding protein
MQKSSLQKTPLIFRTAYDGLADTVSDETGLLCLDPTLAQQQFADESDINTIVNNFMRTGEMPDAVSKPNFGDFRGSVDDYHEALNLVLAAQDAFAALPANIRTRFDNDAGKYVDFFNDPQNQDEAIALGLAEDSRPPQRPDPKISGGDEGGLPGTGKSSSKPSKKDGKGVPHDGGSGD